MKAQTIGAILLVVAVFGVSSQQDNVEMSTSTSTLLMEAETSTMLPETQTISEELTTKARPELKPQEPEQDHKMEEPNQVISEEPEPEPKAEGEPEPEPEAETEPEITKSKVQPGVESSPTDTKLEDQNTQDHVPLKEESGNSEPSKVPQKGDPDSGSGYTTAIPAMILSLVFAQTLVHL